MSSIFLGKLQTPEDLFFIQEAIKKMGITPRLQFQFTNNKDLDSLKEQIVKTSSKSEFVFSIDPKIESRDYYYQTNISDNASSGASASQGQSQSESENDSDLQVQNSASVMSVYSLKDPIKFIFCEVFKKEIKSIQNQFDCRLVEDTRKGIMIYGQIQDMKPLMTELGLLENGLLTYLMKLRLIDGVMLSTHCQEMLAKKDIFVYRQKNKRFFWAKKIRISEKDFIDAIRNLEITHRELVRLLGTRYMLVGTVHFKMMFLCYKTMAKCIAPEVDRLEKLYQVKIEQVDRLFGYIIHTSVEQFSEQVKIDLKQEVTSQQKLFVLKFTIKSHKYLAAQNQRYFVELQNYRKRYCPKSAFLLQQKQGMLCVSAADAESRQKAGPILQICKLIISRFDLEDLRLHICLEHRANPLEEQSLKDIAEEEFDSCSLTNGILEVGELKTGGDRLGNYLSFIQRYYTIFVPKETLVEKQQLPPPPKAVKPIIVEQSQSTAASISSKSTAFTKKPISQDKTISPAPVLFKPKIVTVAKQPDQLQHRAQVSSALLKQEKPIPAPSPPVEAQSLQGSMLSNQSSIDVTQDYQKFEQSLIKVQEQKKQLPALSVGNKTSFFSGNSTLFELHQNVPDFPQTVMSKYFVEYSAELEQGALFKQAPKRDREIQKFLKDQTTYNDWRCWKLLHNPNQRQTYSKLDVRSLWVLATDMEIVENNTLKTNGVKFYKLGVSSSYLDLKYLLLVSPKSLKKLEEGFGITETQDFIITHSIKKL